MSAEKLKGCRSLVIHTKTNSESVVDHSSKTPGGGSKDPMPLKSVSADDIPLNQGVSGLKCPNPLKVGACSPAASALLSFHVPAIKSTHTANLDDLRPPKTPTKTCDLRYIVKACGCNRKILPSTCMSLDCTVCKPHIGRRRALAITQRLRYHKFKPVIYTVFTVPLSARERFYDKREWQKVRLKIWKVLKKKFGARYGVEATHPVGDPVVENGDIIADTDGRIFHPHLNFLWIQYNGWSPFIDVEMLKKEWAKILKVPETVVWTNYSGSPARVMHWAKYVSRTFPGMHMWVGSMRWYGKYPKARKVEPEVCELCGKPYVTIGSISHWDVDDWNKTGWLLGLDPPWMDDSKIMHFKCKKLKPSTRNQHGRNTANSK